MDAVGRPLIFWCVFIWLLAPAIVAAQQTVLTDEESYRLALCREAIHSKGREEARQCVKDLSAAPNLSDAMAQSLKEIEAKLEPEAPEKVLNLFNGPDMSLELLLNSGVWGGVAAFQATGAVLSANRMESADALPWLLGLPPLGTLGGVALGAGVQKLLQPHPGTVAWASSNTWWGFLWGQALGGLLLANNTDVKNIPYGFGIPLTTMSLFPLSAYWAGDVWTVAEGDVGLANSAAFWAPALALPLLLLHLEDPVDIAKTTLGLSMLGHFSALAAAPWVHVPRPMTWLLELGGTVGLLAGFALTPLLGSIEALNELTRSDSFYVHFFTASAALGVATGAVTIGLLNGSATSFASANRPNPTATLKAQIAPLILNNPVTRKTEVSGMTALWRF